MMTHLYTQQASPKETAQHSELADVEDLGVDERASTRSTHQPVVTSKRKRARSDSESNANELEKSWREILGPPPPMGNTYQERDIWIAYHKRKWSIQMKQRAARGTADSAGTSSANSAAGAAGVGILRNNLGGFLRRAQQTLLSSMWQILQVKNDQKVACSNHVEFTTVEVDASLLRLLT